MSGRELAPCGTHAAAQRHFRNGEPLDAACRAAETAYLKKYRQAHSRALRRLAKEQRDRYREIYREELLKEVEA